MNATSPCIWTIGTCILNLAMMRRKLIVLEVLLIAVRALEAFCPNLTLGNMYQEWEYQ